MTARFHKYIAYFLLAITVSIAFFISCTSWLQLNNPYDGFDWSSRTGDIKTVGRTSPAFNLIRPDDRIIAVDGHTLPIRTSLYTDKQTGDIVIFSVERQKNIIRVPIVLTFPPWNIRLNRLLPILVAFGFWIIGTYVFPTPRKGIRRPCFLPAR
jgi:hypothetical protein